MNPHTTNRIEAHAVCFSLVTSLSDGRQQRVRRPSHPSSDDRHTPSDNDFYFVKWEAFTPKVRTIVALTVDPYHAVAHAFKLHGSTHTVTDVQAGNKSVESIGRRGLGMQMAIQIITARTTFAYDVLQLVRRF